ncbi:MAG: sulfatase-like hydrolase/transferase [Planctomycetes bacterium]|nr:sulfatase-like hydrolase/transferase [Planctomycetota bacterium]
MFAALVLSFSFGLQAPGPEVSKLSFATHATLEYWMLTRTVVAGQAPSLALDGMLKAVALLEDLEPDVSRRAMGLADAVMAQSASMGNAAETLAGIVTEWKERGRVGPFLQALAIVELAAYALAETEASFRSVYWLPRQARLERFGERLANWVEPNWAKAFGLICSGLGIKGLKNEIDIVLVTTMPPMVGPTLRAGDTKYVISLANEEGDLRPFSSLGEAVICGAIHATETKAIGFGLDPITHTLAEEILPLRVGVEANARQKLLARAIPQAWKFALGDFVMRTYYRLEGPTYMERKDGYAAMGQTADLLAYRLPALAAEAISEKRSWASAHKQLVRELLAYIARKRKPNVLLILSDDQGWADFSYLGLKDDVATPSLDRLAAEGVTLPQAYASSPICNPSRVGLITGRYQQRWNNYYYGGGRGLPAEATTLAERLKVAGYATGYFGKVHTGGPDNGPNKPGFPLNQGFDRFFGTTCGGRVHYLYHSREAQERYGEAAGQMKVDPMWDDDQQIEWEGFTTVDWTQQTIDFIDSHHDRPWFVFLNHNAVHNFAWQLPEEEIKARGLERFPDWDADEIEYLEWYKGVHRRDWPEGRAYYLAQLEVLDRETGRLIDHIERIGMTDNTLVIYTVDNGGCVPDWADNGPLAGSKYHLMEGGTRVRTFVKMPGVFPEGYVHEGVFSSLDLAPTICELSDIAVESGAFDGRSQVDELKGERKSDPNRTLHWDTGWQWSVRMGEWKLLVTTNETRAGRSANFEQVDVRLGTHLYHLGEDPSEANNLASHRPDLVDMLTDRHRSWRASIGQPVEKGK